MLRRILVGLCVSSCLLGCSGDVEDEPVASESAALLDIGRFREQALRELNAPTPPQTIFQRNQRINAKYAEVFLSDPARYPWYGAAMHASAMVGLALGITESLLAGAPIAVHLLPPGASQLYAVLHALSRPVLEGVYAGLAEGNLKTYLTVYPAVLAYREGGVSALATLSAQGQLDPEYAAGFAAAERGDVASSVHQLLSAEQRKTLPPIFANPSYHLEVLTSGTCMTYNDTLSPLNCFAPWVIQTLRVVPNVTDTNQRASWAETEVKSTYLDQLVYHLEDQKAWARTRADKARCRTLVLC